jgi:hypothetical protein
MNISGQHSDSEESEPLQLSLYPIDPIEVPRGGVNTGTVICAVPKETDSKITLSFEAPIDVAVKVDFLQNSLVPGPTHSVSTGFVVSPSPKVAIGTYWCIIHAASADASISGDSVAVEVRVQSVP